MAGEPVSGSAWNPHLGGVLECLGLAAHHGLTVYDAAYLQLALLVEAEIATRDRVLTRAARAEGMTVHD